MNTFLALFSRLQGWGGWATTFILLAAMWKGLPAIQREITSRRKLDNDDASSIRHELRNDIHDLQEKYDRLARDFHAEKEHRIASDLRLGQFEFVLRMVTDELERVSPDSVVLTQAKSLLAAAFPVRPHSPMDDMSSRLALDKT